MDDSCVVSILNDFFAQLEEEEVYLGEYSEDNCAERESSDKSFYKWYSAAGVSKCAIIPEEGEYVIKFDLDVYEGDYELSSNYADDEADISIRAKASGLGDIFVETKYWGTLHGKNIYLQKKVTFDYEKKSEASKASNKFIDEVIDTSEELSRKYHQAEMVSALGVALYNYYGEEKFEEILDFLRENRINDLHNGNWGYIENRPVIFDYSGFRESDSGYTD